MIESKKIPEDINMATTKFVLFFSNFCKYSKDVIAFITENNIRNDFVLISIDSYKNIPSFVDRVPLIFANDSKEVFTDDKLDKLIQQIAVQKRNQTLMSFNEDKTGGFCFIDDAGATVCSTTGFMSLDEFTEHRIPTPEEFNTNTVKSKKADTSALEKYMAQRDDDLRIVKEAVKH